MNRKTKSELERLLHRAQIEKKTELVPVKLPLSLFSWLRRHHRGHVSSFLRQALIEKLERMVDGK